MTKKKSSIKIDAKSFKYKIPIDDALIDIKKEENTSRFKHRVVTVYHRVSIEGFPSLDFLAFEVFFDYFRPYIENALDSQSRNKGIITIEHSLGTFQTKSPDDSIIQEIEFELEKHVRETYKSFEGTHTLNVKKVLNDFKMSYYDSHRNKVENNPNRGVW